MYARTPQTAFIPLAEISGRLGVPLAWLRAEAKAGRIPTVRIGRRWLGKLHDVEAALDARAKQGATNTPSAGGAA